MRQTLHQGTIVQTESVIRLAIYLKGCNIFEHDLMLFPVHKPKHWRLVVSCRTMSHFKCYCYNISEIKIHTLH